MRSFSFLLLILPAAASVLPAQPENRGPFAVGERIVDVPGSPGGNATVRLETYYPATANGSNTPTDLSGAPYPLVVFGHGFSLPANLYDTLYEHWASHGFVVLGVATEEGLFTGNLPRFVVDFQAAVEGLRAEGTRPGSPLEGLVSANELAASMGHSFGGAAAIVAASRRPDLFAGVVTLAATSTSPQGLDILDATRNLAVPALHVGASLDTIVPPPANLDPLYGATPTTRRSIEIEGGTHSYFHERWWVDRLLESPGTISVAEQQRLTRRYTTAFLDVFLRDGDRWLDEFVGPTANADPGLARQATTWLEPRLFGVGTRALGTTYRLHPLAPPSSNTALFFGLPAAAPLPTPWGLLELDPLALILVGGSPVGVESYATYAIPIPQDPALSGAPAAFQAVVLLGSTPALTNAVR